MTAPVADLQRASAPWRPGPVVEQLAFGVAYVLAGLVAQATSVGDVTLGLIWPASGVTVVWFVTTLRRGRSHALVAALLMLAITIAFSVQMQSDWLALLAFVLAHAVQVVVATACLRSPLFSTSSLFSDDAARTLSTVRGVLGLTGSAAIAGLASAVIMVIGWALLVTSFQVTPIHVLLWWGRSTVGTVGVVALVVLLSAAVRQHRSGAPDGPLTNRSVLDSLDAALARRAGLPEVEPDRHVLRHRVMVAALFVSSAAAYTVDFAYYDRPTVFPLLAFTIWSGLLCSGLVTVLHTMMSATILVSWTVQDRGPFSLAETARVMAIEVQLYLAFILVLGLLLSAARSEIRAALARIVEAEDSSASRADLLSAVTEAMTDGLMVVDASSTIVTANRTAIQLLGIDPSAVVHCEDLGILRPDGTRLPPEEYPSHVAREHGEVGPSDVVVLGADGRPRTLSVVATRLDDAGGRSRRAPGAAPVVVVFSDVTEERAQHDYLAGFAGMVAHDLRSPLTTLRGWLDMCAMLASSDPTAPAADLVEPLDRATLGAVQMARLIDDLLVHVSAHGQVLELEAVDLAQLVREVAEAHGVGEALTTGTLPAVWADRALTHQLVANLVGNAAKYRHPERPLEIALHGQERHGIVTFVLEDNGAGIPDADRDKVFERFYRVAEHRDLGTGTGLGLAMCRTIVERHGGTIRALPRPDEDGTAIEVSLAAVPPPSTTGRRPEPADAEHASPRRHLRPVAD